jgi:hypothetical protein
MLHRLEHPQTYHQLQEQEQHPRTYLQEQQPVPHLQTYLPHQQEQLHMQQEQLQMMALAWNYFRINLLPQH